MCVHIYTLLKEYTLALADGRLWDLREIGGRIGASASAGVCLLPWGSAVWPQCWLCDVCAVGHVGCCVGGGGTLSG